MKLHIVAFAAALALSGLAFGPSFAASSAKAKPAVTSTAGKTKTTTPDPLRFTGEATAQASCATDTVVWANSKSKIFHLKGTASSGKGKNGSYMCQTAATGEGFRPTKKPEKQVTSK